MTQCKKCGYEENDEEIFYQRIKGIKVESRLQEHHIIPKCCGGTDTLIVNEEVERNTRWLCDDCHAEIHKRLTGILCRFIPQEKKELCQKAMYEYTKRNWLKEKTKGDSG